MKHLALTLLFLLTACSSADLLNATITREGYRVVRDIPYGEEARQQLDLYIPDQPQPSKPVLFFIYGGSWQMGNKGMYRFVGQAFASRGYITVVADYRLYPEVSYPVFLKENARALAWVQRHIADYGGDGKNLYLVGHSAGAYNAAMLALRPALLREAGASSKGIRGMIGLAGPYDFLPLTDPKLIALFSTAPLRDTQPIHYVTNRSARTMPFFLATGDADDTVQPRNSLRLGEALRAHGGQVESHRYPGIGHVGIVLALAEGFRGRAPVLDEIDRFVQRTRAH